MREGRAQRYGHAIVIGGSVAGLLAARALSDYFARVTVVDRDRFPEGPSQRKGVPHGRHLHILLARGGRILDSLLPGFRRELGELGAPTYDLVADTAWFQHGRWKPRFPSSLWVHSCSRELLEWAMRRRVGALPGIVFLQDTDVVGLEPGETSDVVAGVHARARAGASGEAAPAEILRADLVVDASGRTSRAPRWLERLGFPAPRDTTVNAFLGYATRAYRRPSRQARDWQFLLLSADLPANPRGAAIQPIEGDRWIVTLAGYGKRYPPTDEAGFLDFAKALTHPALVEAIKGAEPLTPIVGYQRTENRLRHFERLDRWPERFVVLGDAVCAFNPVYGQGMSVAALEAEALSACLDARVRRARPGTEDELRGIGREIQRRLPEITRTPWLLATGEDFRVPETTGIRPGALSELLRGYSDRVIELGADDRDAHLAFSEVLQLVSPPTALAQPKIVARVAMRAIREKRAYSALPGTRDGARDGGESASVASGDSIA